VGDREILEIYLNLASKNTSETDIFPHGTKSLLISEINESTENFIYRQFRREKLYMEILLTCNKSHVFFVCVSVCRNLNTQNGVQLVNGQHIKYTSSTQIAVKVIVFFRITERKPLELSRIKPRGVNDREKISERQSRNTQGVRKLRQN
jgi:hypothetical protein